MRNVMLVAMFLAAAFPAAAANLDVYFIDVEGGQATLLVAPSGQSMLVDAGWPGNNGRDAGRIAAAAKLAGINQIDYLLVTHHHLDHVGGVPEVAAKIPVITFVDHGPNTETDAGARKLSAAYEKAREGRKHLAVKAGDRIPLEGVDVRIVESGGQGIVRPLEGAGAANAVCAGVKPQEADPSENAQSVGFLLTYGKFRIADFGDLTWNKELALVCPKNLLGAAEVYVVTHHGMDISNSPAIVQALHPKVAIMDNGAKKGGTPQAWATIKNSPGLEDLWQLHYSIAGGAGHNSPEELIANPEGGPDQGNWIKLTARADGSFTVLNGRNKFQKTYRK